jgi:precorrin-6Y C5,15-methyltransferase (decarboxylating)
MNERNDIQIIGIGDDGAGGLFPYLLPVIEDADVLVGGERHLNFFPHFRGEKITITGKLTELVTSIRETQAAGKKAVVLASGDPLFYGIGSYLASKLEGIVIHPNLSSIQLAFARKGLGWQDAYIHTLHGKPIQGMAQRIDGKDRVAILTDHHNTPAKIAQYLLDFGMTEYTMFVAENLGGEEERCTDLELEEALSWEGSHLNVVLLLKKPGAVVKQWPLGIDDAEFSQRKPDKGLITKREVRVLSLAELGLKKNSVIWDIGTCTGSVAIEAAKLAPEGQVFAIEKNEGDLENARANARKFRVDLTLVHGKAPQGLEDWPDPDAVFIGGSGGEMGELLRILSERLRKGGRVVLNAATIETLYEATTTFKKLGMQTRVTLLQTSRSKPILDMTRFEGLNPIYIITAWKAEPAAEEETE